MSIPTDENVSEFDPIINVEHLRRPRMFQKPPMPQAGVTLVIQEEGQAMFSIQHGDTLTAGERRWRRPAEVYKVKVSEFSFSFECQLPSKNEVYEFQASANLACYVDDPVKIVETGIRDVRRTLEPLVIRTMREHSYKYDLEQRSTAETDLVKQVEAASYGVGLATRRFFLELKIDSVAYDRKKEHVAQKHEADLESKRAGYHRTHESAKVELELSLAARKMKFYEPMIRDGQWKLLVHKLATKPGDVDQVIETILRQDMAKAEYTLKALQMILEKADTEEWEIPIKDVTKQIIDTFKSGMKAPLLGTGEAPKYLDQSDDGENEQEEVK